MRLSLIGIVLASNVAFAMPVAAQSVVANPENGTADAGIASRPIVNVAANDTVNGAPATLGASGNATVAKSGTWPTGLGLNPTTGAVSTTIAVTAGVYPIQYQLCDKNTPPDCSTTTDTVTVINSVIVANSQSGTADAGIASRPIANVAAGDTVNGAPATLGSSGNSTVSAFGTWQTGIGLNPTTGAVSTTIAVPAGVYPIQYQLCDLNLPANCSIATDTVTVINSVIVANSQSGTADAGIASIAIANVLAGDTVNGAPVTLGSSGNATLAKSNWPSGFGLNPTTGALTTTIAVTAGVYPLQYQLCDLNLPANCSTATDTVTVINSVIVANSQSGSADAGVASQPINNVVATDTVNGAAATLGSSGDSTLAKSGTWPAGFGLNPLTGALTTSAAVAAGVYPLQYQLCDLNVPPNCNTATDTVTIVASSVIANPDSGTADFGIASRPIANVAVNDTVNGAPAILGASGNATVAKVATWPTGLGLTPSTGAVSTTISLPAGTYQVQYQLCDLNTPANCGTTTVTVTVINSVIVANSQSGTADYGIASQPIANVAATDTVNGAPVILGATTGNATVSAVGTWPTGIALTPSTGAISTTKAVLDGVYPVQYKLCDLNVPAHCSSPTTDTVTVITASILALPQTGIANGGTASTPIPNTTVGDTVNGAVVTLGPSGNAQITKVGTWPTGFSLISTSGAVSASNAVLPGTYDFQYELCDLNVPANCSVATDEVTVTSTVVANPDTGTAVSGKASTPIHNVAINDTVNGVEARLQTSPNAKVSALGTWPAGIALNTTTGAVTTTTAVQPGSYVFSYQLCDLNTPATCSTAADTLTVDASLVVVWNAGSSVVDIASKPVANVVANDVVNGVAATLGSTGNSIITQSGTWPAGIGLNPKTGAVLVGATVPAGTYQLQYQLCDRATPPDCATAAIVLTVTQPFVEVSVSPYMTGDLEFDWARDGLYCATCNFGSGNSQVNWTDRNNNLWVSGVNAATGMFVPISGKGNGTPVDTTAFFWQDWGNGPEWAFSTPPGAPGGNPISQLVYTRYAPDEPATWQYAGAAIATQTDGAPTWAVSFLPGAYSPIINNTVLPEASQCPSDPVSYTVFENLYTTTQMFTEPVSTAPGTVPTLTPFGALANGIGERFVPCTTWLTFQGDVTIGDNNLQQVFWYDRVTQTVQQLTFDPTTKQRGVMFRAPEFTVNGVPQFTLMVLAGDDEIQIYTQNGTYPNGAPLMQLVNTIHSPDPVEPWMFDPKAFIHCSAAYPTCRTFVVVGLGMQANPQLTETQPTGLAVTSIDPLHPMFEIMVTAESQPATQRLDPKYFVTASGPVVYYDRLLALTNTSPYQDEGIYLINMQLGAPSGPCVGSSAQEGLNPTWPNCTAGVPP